MYAVVDIAGQQFQVEEGAVLRVPRLDLEEGAKQTFSNVLLVRSDNETLVGSPHVAGAAVEATVVGHVRGDKIIIFKMKRRNIFFNGTATSEIYTADYTLSLTTLFRSSTRKK
jgi:large subunit ribosomal protein L21